MPSDLRRTLLAMRSAVLTAALPQYDAMARSYIAAIADRPQEATALAAEATDYARWYQRDSRAAHLPPMLARAVWEPPGEWIARAYAAGGYA